VHYICHAESKSFQPANITFDLLPQMDEATRRRVRDKKQRHKMVCEKALERLASWRQETTAAVPQPPADAYEPSIRD
jgi:methylenetetrahydrofolate--tRNA-(uracil-5-)-methyltransferase